MPSRSLSRAQADAQFVVDNLLTGNLLLDLGQWYSTTELAEYANRALGNWTPGQHTSNVTYKQVGTRINTAIKQRAKQTYINDWDHDIPLYFWRKQRIINFKIKYGVHSKEYRDVNHPTFDQLETSVLGRSSTTANHSVDQAGSTTTTNATPVVFDMSTLTTIISHDWDWGLASTRQEQLGQRTWVQCLNTGSQGATLPDLIEKFPDCNALQALKTLVHANKIPVSSSLWLAVTLQWVFDFPATNEHGDQVNESELPSRLLWAADRFVQKSVDPDWHQWPDTGDSIYDLVNGHHMLAQLWPHVSQHIPVGFLVLEYLNDQKEMDALNKLVEKARFDGLPVPAQWSSVEQFLANATELGLNIWLGHHQTPEGTRNKVELFKIIRKRIQLSLGGATTLLLY